VSLQTVVFSSKNQQLRSEEKYISVMARLTIDETNVFTVLLKQMPF